MSRSSIQPDPQTEPLPLESATPDHWADQVLREPLALLGDHAHLEKKAAANALELMTRWPGSAPPTNWVVAMAAIARDEAVHLGRVGRILKQRGGVMPRRHNNAYASDLRGRVRRGRANEELLDRLLVSALIELRSCERFGVLARCCPDAKLAEFYRGLWASEFGHYKVFLKLARHVGTADDVDCRWREWLRAEAEIIAAQAPGPRMHSGVADE